MKLLQYAFLKRTLQRFASETLENDHKWDSKIGKFQNIHVFMQLSCTFRNVLNPDIENVNNN